MITTEIITMNDRQFQRTVSDTYMIRQVETGAVYSEAVDVLPCVYTYEETDEPLEEATDGEAEQE